MSPGWMALRNLVLIVGLPMLWIVTGRVQRKERERQAARERRIGWAFGYGAGVVDGRHGRYAPSPPAVSGRSRHGGNL